MTALNDNSLADWRIEPDKLSLNCPKIATMQRINLTDLGNDMDFLWPFYE